MQKMGYWQLVIEQENCFLIDQSKLQSLQKQQQEQLGLLMRGKTGLIIEISSYFLNLRGYDSHLDRYLTKWVFGKGHFFVR
jgi:hypothetical protein